jgi:hypothetical protein
LVTCWNEEVVIYRRPVADISSKKAWSLNARILAPLRVADETGRIQFRVTTAGKWAREFVRHEEYES